jgi:hypothetical protein
MWIARAAVLHLTSNLLGPISTLSRRRTGQAPLNLDATL